MPMPVHPGGWQELEVKFRGDSKKFGFFLVQLIEFVWEWGCTFSYKGAYLGAAAYWFVTFYHGQGPQMQNVQEFMQELREQFEDPLEPERAHVKLQSLWQGSRSVQEHTAEFRETASQVWDWPEAVKVQ